LLLDKIFGEARHRGQIEADMTHSAQSRAGGRNADIGGVSLAAI
jgi:hypothetical protein